MKRLLLLLFLFTMGFSFQGVHAINPISIEAFHELEVKKDQKEGLFHKMKKIIAKVKSEQGIRTLAILSLIAGVLSLVGLFVAISLNWSLLIVALLAILADVLGIIVIAKTRKERKTYRSAFIMGILGLITGLLTGLLPLALLVIILIALR